jgi:hypothetical protein
MRFISSNLLTAIIATMMELIVAKQVNHGVKSVREKAKAIVELLTNEEFL